MLFYPAKVNNGLNRRPYLPELHCGRVMLNPNYPVQLTKPVPALCDSGAFQDIDKGQRLLPWAALDRQLAYERRVSAGLAGEWHFEAIVTYDQMLGVDEQIVDGKKVKQRGNEDTARAAIAETLRAATYYSRHRDRVAGALCFAAQGATPTQYVQECVIPLLDLMQPGDWFAFGGFCIIGRVPSLKPLFAETARAVLPLLRRKGIRRAHLLGIGVTDMVRLAAQLGREHGVVMSTDTSSIEVNSVLGKVFDGARWHYRYTKEQKGSDYHPCELAHANLLYYDAFCASLAPRPHEQEIAA